MWRLFQALPTSNFQLPIMKLSQKSLEYRFLKNIRENNLIQKGDRVIVALSGGADSVCLFDLLCKLKDELNVSIQACHYNHRMRGEESYNDEEFVKQVCRERGVNCFFGSTAKNKILKSEETARDARYDFFEKILEESGGAKIAIAHNADDFAETLLLRLIRGTGLFGLQSIPQIRENFIRPLLPFSRKEIEEYLRAEGLDYCIDKSNSDTKYDRNFVRLNVIPLLKKINPNLEKTLQLAGQSIQDDYKLLLQISEKSFTEVLDKKNDREIILNREKWILLPLSIQRQIVRLALAEIGSLKDVTQKQIEEVIALIQAGEGNKLKILPHSLLVRLKSGKIIISVK